MTLRTRIAHLRPMRKSVSCLGWFLLLFASVTSTVSGEIVQPDREIVYKTIENAKLKLIVFDPPSRPRLDRSPAVVFFFGGGWSGGTPKQFYDQARFLADRGVVAFCAEYRIQSKHNTSPFECVKDGKSAIRWVRSHASDLGVDPTEIVAAGGSAGGHVAACTGVVKGHEEKGENLEISSVPNAMILFNPVLDTTDRGLGIERVGRDRQTEISPCHHVRAGLPPTLLFHGTADKTVPFENAERFTRLMNEAGNTCRLESFEGEEHGFFNSRSFRRVNDPTIYPRTLDKSIEFLTSLGYLDPKERKQANLAKQTD